MKKHIGIIGCGYWGKNLIRNFQELNVLHSICDIDKQATDIFKLEYPHLNVTHNYLDLLSSPEVEAVVISTPAATHYQLVKNALQADKDVLVEKPIALKYSEGEELASLAQKRNRVLMVGHILKYHPSIAKLEGMVRNGDFGKLRYIYSNRLNLGKFRTEENILWSFAPHDISIVLSLVNEMPQVVSSHGGNFLNPNITDVTVTTLTFSQNIRAHLFVSWLHPYKEQKLVVIGSKKMLMFDDVKSKDQLFLYSHKIDWIKGVPTPRPEDAQPIPVDYREPLKSECEHFLECIETRKTPITDANEGLRVLKILEACQRSLKANGAPIRVKDVEV